MEEKKPIQLKAIFGKSFAAVVIALTARQRIAYTSGTSQEWNYETWFGGK